VKVTRIFLSVLFLGVLGFSFSCSKKPILSEAGYVPSRYETRSGEQKPQAEVKPEAGSPEGTAALDQEKKLREESLREEALREKALREKAQREEAARREAAAREAARKELKLEPVFFDYDQWSIRDNQKEVMIKDGEWLKINAQTKVRLEGHCDERGTAEYNLALGQKRADAAKIFLEGLGINGQRISTISYGKERPLDPGHNEDAWAKNRRVDIVPVR